MHAKFIMLGSTSNEFKVRFRNHKSAMSTKKTTCEVAVHFNKEKHQLSDFEFIVIKQICNIDDKHNVDKRLFTREAVCCKYSQSLDFFFYPIWIRVSTINALYSTHVKCDF